MHFSLVKINPEDASPSHGFDDVIFPLYHALRSLGFETEILFNRTNSQSLNIVFGSCIAPRRVNRMLPPGSVIFNLEQINQESKWCNEHYLAHLRSFTVWDYSQSNIAALHKLGITDTVHVPLGYVPEMIRLKNSSGISAPLLFYGLVTERRHQLIQNMLKANINILATQEAFGDLRDKLLAGCRAVLNIHQFLPAKLEIVRLSYVWANKIAVISEYRPDTEIPDYLHESCLFAPYAELPGAASALLADTALLKRQAEAGFKAFASRPLAETLRKIVGHKTQSVAARTESEAALIERPYFTHPAHEWLIKK